MAGITSGFGELLRSGNYSDFKITCKGAEFNVHRAIVCSASDFFKALCDSGFKVSSCSGDFSKMVIDALQEQSAGSVDLPDDDPETVKRMIDFLYTGRYEAFDPNESSIGSGEVARASSRSSEHASMTAEVEETDGRWIDSEEPGSIAVWSSTKPANLADLKTHIMVYLIADKFDMQQLKDYALDTFKASFDTLSREAREMSGFADLLTFAYESTSSHDYGLRAQITRACIFWATSWADGITQAASEVVMTYEPMAFHLGQQMPARHATSWGASAPCQRCYADDLWNGRGRNSW